MFAVLKCSNTGCGGNLATADFTYICNIFGRITPYSEAKQLLEVNFKPVFLLAMYFLQGEHRGLHHSSPLGFVRRGCTF